jgi:MFS family permease
MGDRQSLYAAAFVRSVSTGMIGVLLGVYLAELKLDATTIGVLIGVGLAGATLATLAVTVAADRVGHRRSLVLISLLSAGGAIALTLSSHPLALGIAAFVGMVNGMGRDRGAALVLEQALLPATTSDHERTNVFARYNVLQDMGHALGALLAGVPALFERWSVQSEVSALQMSVGIYAILCLLPCMMYPGLSPRMECGRLGRGQPVSEETRRILWRMSSLFALDSLGGGFLTTALLSFFFREKLRRRN